MVTPANRLRQIVVATVESASPDTVSLEALYRAVEQQIVLGQDDLVPPNLHGSAVAEPRWKRNVRNVLQHMKESTELVNIRRNAWQLPTPDPLRALDDTVAWAAVHGAAEMAIREARQLRFTQQEHRYVIQEAGDEKIVITRLDGRSPDTLSRVEVERGIRYLNAAGGRLGRRTVHYTVAKEVAFVSLHPDLEWSDDQDWIEVTARERPRSRPIYRDFGEAPNDDPTKLSSFSRKVRKGQPKFRRRLLDLYEERCAVSGWGPPEVLEAAHIDFHFKSGINHAENGLLLRADLHVLFDEGLLRIHPDTYTVVMDPSLRDGPYWELNGRTLRLRKNGGQPRREYLLERWKSPAEEK